ncbi:hypothetical protein I2I11_11780 [Pontibacter sp. 172403-2]|uniref:hypothetical protein n=1 Tax=Pontibacter rufus TaxID=2791028 RepID=UPI0018B00E2D|nr:hypothetical protein [Pontibacter sp. 172403-2]MBF9253973.1 hypothetical protein [Pontibacter sp. 172403-2]
MKSFYEFNRNSPQERRERNSLYPKLARFHIALREELSEEEYQAFYRAEKEALASYKPMYNQTQNRWAAAY